MDGHRIEATVEKDGELTLEGLPFHAGEEVEVIILPRHGVAGGRPSRMRLGTPVMYDRPFDPVATDDWEAA